MPGLAPQGQRGAGRTQHRWPQYTFHPVTNKTRKKKRRVRETEPKDIKRCKKIVELLCNGKANELKYVVKDLNNSHAPEFVTRFEAPITERAYRRSSSAPLPDTDYGQSKQAFKLSALPHRKWSSSVEPEGFSPVAETQLPTSGLAQFDATFPFDSSPPTPGHSTPFPQQEGYIDFSNYASSGPAVSDSFDSFSHSFASVTPSPPPYEFANISQLVSPRKSSYARLSITTAFLEQWMNSQSSPSAVPESPVYYSSGASSPSEAITPFEESFPLAHCGFERPRPQSEESYGYGSQVAGYPYANVPGSVSSPPPPAYPYYSGIQELLKDGFQYPSHTGMDYLAFLQPTYTA